MFTQCTECKKLHQITVEDLRRFRGMHYCKKCSTWFDALVQLSETPPDVSGNYTVKTKTPFWQTTQKPAPSISWGVGLAAGLVLLVFQSFHFERDYFIQNKRFRPWLKKACATFNCQLPAYRSLNDLSVLQSKFSPLSEDSLQLLAVFVNQAPFPQSYPAIRMILQEFNGKPFAQRIFYPEDYLSQLSERRHMAVGEQLEIDLRIARPQIPIGGFTIDLI